MDSVTRLRKLEERIAREGRKPDLLVALARTWRRLDNPARAEQLTLEALRLDDSAAPAWNTLGAALLDQERWAEGERACREALRRNPGLAVAETNLAIAVQQQAWNVHRAAQHGDWGPWARDGARLLSMHRARMKQGGAPLLAPFSALGFHLHPAEQRAAAEGSAREFLSGLQLEAMPAPRPRRRRAGDRLRVGYFSADFRDNAAGHLLQDLFAAHDRGRCEAFALSYGPEDGSDFRRAIRAGVEHFVELRDTGDDEAAERIRALELDVLVDLMGFAGNHRAPVLARRPAPLQVLWLGYCMTTGAPWIDAFIADRITVPPELEAAFSERLAFLPASYQVYSGQTFDRTTSRAAWGLPDGAVIYACFNMPEKIDPPIWDRWMAILRAVPEGRLWLLAPDATTARNYQDRAGKAGVDPGRILPAPLLPKAQHLARATHADLFLDTTLCNAHTTASDALWAGVPVLTCPGELFAQRVAASVCHAAGFPDLVVEDMDAYVETAIALGHAPERRASLRAKLTAARDSAPLFDVTIFAREFEDLLERLVNEARGPGED